MRRMTATLLMTASVATGCSHRNSLSSGQGLALENAAAQILAAAALAEAITDGYSTVWSQAIQGGGNFSDSLRTLRDSADVKAQLDKLHQAITEAEARVKVLQKEDLPEPVFEQVGATYESLARLARLADAPTGSLQSFNSATAELTSRIAGGTARIRLYEPAAK